MSDSNDEEVSEVSEEFKHLFKGSRFKFEGLSANVEEDFVNVVKEMGAKVSSKAQISFVQSSYFEERKIGERKDFYNINYIADSVEAGKALDLKNYIFVPDGHLDDEPLCYAARYMYRTDSCQECYYSKVFCKKCVEESIKESSRAANQDRNHIISETDTSLKNEIMNSPGLEALGHSSKSSKRIISSDSEQQSNDKEQRKSNCAGSSPVRKKFKISNDVDVTFNRGESLEIYVEEATNGISGTAHNVIEPKTLRLKTNGVAEKTDNISLSDDPRDSKSNTRNDKKPLQKGKAASISDWIIQKQPVKTDPPALPEPKPLPNILLIIDEEKYFTGRDWWQPKDIPENERCTVPFCSFEPTFHPIHHPSKKFLSLVEKKILIKYLIIKNTIGTAKGNKVYQNMIEDGYLTHRSDETLRNCFRRTILNEIRMYNLGKDILNKFETLRRKK